MKNNFFKYNFLCLIFIKFIEKVLSLYFCQKLSIPIKTFFTFIKSVVVIDLLSLTSPASLYSFFNFSNPTISLFIFVTSVGVIFPSPFTSPITINVYWISSVKFIIAPVPNIPVSSIISPLLFTIYLI